MCGISIYLSHTSVSYNRTNAVAPPDNNASGLRMTHSRGVLVVLRGHTTKHNLVVILAVIKIWYACYLG
jgi:hypothetical protein